jgi:SAM-dependent methyltransferase
MLVSDIGLLECVDCRGDLHIHSAERRDGHILDGILRCGLCGAMYPVLRGVGIFFRKEVALHFLSKEEFSALRGSGNPSAFGERTVIAKEDQKQLLVAKNWQYQWEQVAAYDAAVLTRDSKDLYGSDVFWKFIPIPPESVLGKTLYVACAGRGREAFHLTRQNPAKLIINEIGSEIYAISDLIADFKGKLLLLRCDVSYSPLKQGIADITICDHALQHVSDHTLGFSSLVKATKKNGLVCICVYSRENNFLMVNVIEPIKIVLRRLPLKLLRMLALVPAALIFLIIQLIYRPMNSFFRKTASRLPLFEHMMFWSRNNFATIWMSCFDLIHAPISYHFTRAEVENLAQSNDLAIEKIVNTNGTLWSLVARKKQP